MSQLMDEIEECVPALRRYARALTHDPDRADDLVQDSLERAIRKRGLWRPSGSVRSWMFRILLNVYRNDLRRQRRSPVPLSLETIPGSDPAGLDVQPGRLALAETARAMQALPLEQREVLLLVAVEEMKYSEAAAILSIPIGTLMSRLARARSTLRDLTQTGTPKLRSVK
ncbi:sigma-70 family RNA polymerase sigma factor [Shinella kummerowiae]|uniref:sigma-70 family RNA polymerase sigma factor n=1 Tax=Shinella kummerowiae TaxID=417745 RepID=UPI0021B4F022|nr:sigma-70 family RNA polymerase sigma factor [Shinella kummerowiae]MCT7666086.1 sigma-70 family RNA polymerase sigma factor [Shinella kummerowiae]